MIHGDTDDQGQESHVTTAYFNNVSGSISTDVLYRNKYINVGCLS